MRYLVMLLVCMVACASPKPVGDGEINTRRINDSTTRYWGLRVMRNGQGQIIKWIEFDSTARTIQFDSTGKIVEQ